jgi:hypothetical protein
MVWKVNQTDMTLLYEVTSLILSLVPVIYCSWLYLKRKEKHFIYLALGFTFLTLSMLIQQFSSTWWTYTMQLGIPYRYFELATLAFFACFVISTIIALEKMSKISSTDRSAPSRPNPDLTKTKERV